MSDLSRENEAALASILSEVVDPALRVQLERKLRAKLMHREKLGSENREVFNDAYGRAVALGIEDPLEYAQRAVKIRKLERITERNLKALRKAPRNAAAKDADRLARKIEKLSRTANPRRRRNPQSDLAYVRILGLAQEEGWLGDADLVGAEIEKQIPGYKPPIWEKSGPAMKILGLALETHRRGGRTINLRLSKELEDKAIASSRGPVSFLQNQVRETLKRAFADDAPEFWCVLERDSSNRLHLHGAYIHEPHVDHHLIDAALGRAGRWEPPLGKGLPQKSEPLTEPFVWVAYILKHTNHLAMEIERKLFAATAGLRSDAIGRWPEVRSTLPSSASRARNAKS